MHILKYNNRMRRKKLRITEMDYLKANRRASRQEEIASHGHPIQGQAMIHKSKKVYDRNRMKRAAIKSDDSSHFLSYFVKSTADRRSL